MSVHKHLASEPDVCVRVYPDKGGMPAYASLHVDEITLYTNSFMIDLPKQLDIWVRLGQHIIDAANKARPDIPRVA